MFKQVEEAVAWMEQRRFITKGIASFKQYMTTLHDPQNTIPCIHIAGTNGKGSTLNYMRSILQEANYRIGTFTSPYLEVHFDRIRINDQNIDAEVFLSLVNSHYEDWISYELNMFEIDFVIASLYFAKEKVDYAIYEVGLGGTTDATNVIQPMVSIITNIGKDHMDLLGNTYEEIATAKAGIIKPYIPLITAEDKAECLYVFQKQCEHKKSELILIEKPPLDFLHSILTFEYDGIFFKCEHTPMYQTMNICCAVEAMIYLRHQKSIEVRDTHIQSGIQKSHWKGRFEIIQQDPMVLLDGAHNLEGVKALCASMQEYPNIHILFSALKDKNHDAMIEELLLLSSDVTVCEFDFYRGTSCEELAKQYPVNIERDYHKAVESALHKEGTILITGSLYFISEIRKYLLRKLDR